MTFRPPIDFGVAAADYAKHRPGFPDAFFDRARELEIGLPGQRVVDLGTGTGLVARGFARRGCRALGLDPSAEMLRAAVALDAAAGVVIPYVRAVAEATGLASGIAHAVSAGQCWHWFDRRRAGAEVARILRPGGRVIIASLNYVPDAGTLGGRTEELILRRNPGWPLAGKSGRFPEYADELTAAGLALVETFEIPCSLTFTQESWRGRFRACNGVFTMSPADAAAFDAELADVLAREWPERLEVPHLVFALVGRK